MTMSSTDSREAIHFLAATSYADSCTHGHWETWTYGTLHHFVRQIGLRET